MFSFFLFSVCALLSLVSALPLVSPVVRDVWVPRITLPIATSVWSAGGTYLVTWDTSSEPSQVTNPLGKVFLRINDATQSTPIAEDFPLSAGQVYVTVPSDTQPSDQWILVLMGDSGNWSPTFTITPSS